MLQQRMSFIELCKHYVLKLGRGEKRTTKLPPPRANGVKDLAVPKVRIHSLAWYFLMQRAARQIRNHGVELVSMTNIYRTPYTIEAEAMALLLLS